MVYLDSTWKRQRPVKDKPRDDDDDDELMTDTEVKGSRSRSQGYEVYAAGVGICVSIRLLRFIVRLGDYTSADYSSSQTPSCYGNSRANAIMGSHSVTSHPALGRHR